jgi:hypothetical protein
VRALAAQRDYRLQSHTCGRAKKKVRAQFYNLLRQGSKVTILLVECLQTAANFT